MANIDRFIQGFPGEVADMLRVMLKKYKEGAITRQKLMEELQRKLDPAFNTIDAAVGRAIPSDEHPASEETTG